MSDMVEGTMDTSAASEKRWNKHHRTTTLVPTQEAMQTRLTGSYSKGPHHTKKQQEVSANEEEKDVEKAV